MKKVIITICFVLVLCFCFAGCVNAERQAPEKNTKSKMLLNSGSQFIYVVQDPDTKVWYISDGDGITPRLNSDGSLFVSE